MEDRPRPHHRLGSQEQVFDLEQVAISQRGVISALVRNTKTGMSADSPRKTSASFSSLW